MSFDRGVSILKAAPAVLEWRFHRVSEQRDVSHAGWDSLAAGHACPFDAPRADDSPHWNLVARLKVSSWYLPHNQAYRGHGIVVFDPHHATRLDQLTVNEWQAYAVDLHRVVRAIVSVCKPDHMNIESLGNLMPHLHWHVIPRYKNDGRWGQPIWAPDVASQPDRRLADDDRAALLAALRAELLAAAEEASPPPIG